MDEELKALLPGMWDEDDDCCVKRCTREHQCKEGDGHCIDSNDCQSPLVCGNDNCLDQTYFPRNIFTNNSETYQYSPTDNCCYRPCNKRYHLCGHHEMGCESNEDCQTGLYCNKNYYRCEDINECSPNNRQFEGLVYCGSNSVCSNNIGSFTCTCNSGFNDFQPFDGCVDIDECKVGGNNCGGNTDCWNTEGSFLCACKVGFTGNPTGNCIDINECLNQEWNTCSSNEIIYMQTCQTGWRVKELSPHIINDGHMHKYSFLLSSNRDRFKLMIGGGDGYYHYIFEINKNDITIKSCTPTVICPTLKTSSLTSSAKIEERFKNYFMTFQFLEGTNHITFGVNEDQVIATAQDNDANVDTIRRILISNMVNDFQCSYLSNFHRVFESSTCMNTVGSYTCIDDSSEKIGIGFGGHTTSGSTYPSEITVITANKAVCSSHQIEDIAGRIAPGMNDLDPKINVWQLAVVNKTPTHNKNTEKLS